MESSISFLLVLCWYALVFALYSGDCWYALVFALYSGDCWYALMYLFLLKLMKLPLSLLSPIAFGFPQPPSRA